MRTTLYRLFCLAQNQSAKVADRRGPTRIQISRIKHCWLLWIYDPCFVVSYLFGFDYCVVFHLGSFSSSLGQKLSSHLLSVVPSGFST